MTIADLEFWTRAAWAAAWLGAGWAVFIWLMNRFLIHLRVGRAKKLVVGLILLALTAGVAWIGFRTGWSPWAVLPVAVLAGMTVAEARRLRLRCVHRGSPPVDRTDVPLSLGRPLTTLDLVVTRYRIEIPRWHGPSLRIAHLSDFHISDSLPLDYYRSALARVAEAKPDLVLITGDFVSRNEFCPLLAQVMTAVAAGPRVFGILGNHDYWAGEGPVIATLERAGVVLLHDRTERVDLGGPGRLLLSGCEHPWGGRPVEPPENRGPEDLWLVMSHTADNVYRLQRGGADAVFCGHYHAGQFRLPGFGAVVIPSWYGRRFDHGHFVVGGTHLFVTAGIGVSSPPFRLYCHPDLFVVDIAGARPD
jgi:uncharacterized protein